MSNVIYRNSPDFPPKDLSKAYRLYFQGGNTRCCKTISQDWFAFGNDSDIIAYELIQEKDVLSPEEAKDFLEEALFALGDRAAERDSESERSMASAVNSFNAMFGTNLTEEQGWQFMVFLKISRSKQGKFKADDYTDMAAYAALSGEAAAKSRT